MRHSGHSLDAWLFLALVVAVWLGMANAQNMTQEFTQAILDTFGLNGTLTANNVSRMVDSCGTMMEFQTQFNQVRRFL